MINIKFYSILLILFSFNQLAQAAPASRVITGTADIVFLEPTRTSIKLVDLQESQKKSHENAKMIIINASTIDGTMAWRILNGIGKQQNNQYQLYEKNNHNKLDIMITSNTTSSKKYPNWFTSKNKKSSINITINSPPSTSLGRYILPIDMIAWSD